MTMKKILSSLLAFTVTMGVHAQKDSLQLQEIVVTGTRNATDVRHLPMTVTIIDRNQLTEVPPAASTFAASPAAQGS